MKTCLILCLSLLINLNLLLSRNISEGKNNLGDFANNPSSTEVTDSVWVDYPNNPIFTDNNNPTLPEEVRHGKVIYDNGIYKMWYSAGYSNARGNIWYAESQDGISWTTIGNHPVLNTGGLGSWDYHVAVVNAVIKENNQYKMYYGGNFTHPNDGIWRIGIAVSADGINWEKAPNPVLNTDAYNILGSADVLKKDNIFYMYFDYRGFSSTIKIGLATSTDGYNWQINSNPALIANQPWEANNVSYPAVINDGGIFKMLYTNGLLQDAFGIAVSTDGINFTKQLNPVFTKANTSSFWDRISYPCFRRFNNQYRIYYSGEKNAATSISFAYCNPNYTLTVLKSGDCNGKVKVNGEINELPFSGNYNGFITLDIVPDLNCSFTGWSGDLSGSTNPITINMDAGKTITANFNDITPALLALEPPDKISNNQEFDLKVKIENVSDLKVISFDLIYPSEFIDYVNYTVENFLSSGSAVVIPDDNNGKVSGSFFSFLEGATGSGFIVTFKFRITGNQSPGSTFQFCFQNILANNTNGNPIDVSSQCTSFQLTGITVWPGDTNNDGLVNIIDINPIINYFNSTGPSRIPEGILWDGQLVYPWNPENKSYADCNGNGIVEITDINAVIINFNKTHSNLSAANNIIGKDNNFSKTSFQNPPLSVSFIPGATGGQEFWVDITIGSSSLPITEMSVLSFELKYTGTQYIDYISYEVGNFLTGYTPTVISEDQSGKISASAFNITQGSSGYGQVFRFKFKVLDSVLTPHDIMFYWGLVSANKTGGTEQLLDTIGFTNGVVPVELESFNASVSNNYIELNWSTTSETNNKGFDVERSPDNSRWDKISFVPGFGTSTEKHEYKYSDKPAKNGSYSYRIKQLDYNGLYNYSQITTVDFNIKPEQFVLEQNYPNPFNPVTTINYAIDENNFITLKIFDVLGNEIKTLVNEQKTPGYYSINFDASNLSSGIYFYVLTKSTFTKTMKMQLLK